MALLLETVLELPVSDQFEFVFFGKKDRVIEWHEEDKGIHDYYYSDFSAPDTFVNSWFQNIGGFCLDVPNWNLKTEGLSMKEFLYIS